MCCPKKLLSASIAWSPAQVSVISGKLLDSAIIGIICYIDPTRTWAIAVALKDYGSRVWGLYNNAGDKNNGMAGIRLESNAVYNVYDLPLIQNISQNYTVNDANMRDDTLSGISDIGLSLGVYNAGR